jgi:hypothetical protein
MSIDTAIARIQQIVAMQAQLANPASLASAGSTAASMSPSATTDTSSGSTDATTFAAALASAQSGSGSASGSASTASASASGYVNPLANAHVKAERIDQGVDYAGSGTLGAIGPGVVTQVVKSGSGWEGGGYVEYKLTAGPYAGHSVYYAEGVTPTVSVGQRLSPGQQVATIIPGWPTGMELGFAAGKANETSYATAYGGGYSEGALTAAGQAFSNLIASLGGPAGLAEGRRVTGTFK